jgi:hypothetical protein
MHNYVELLGHFVTPAFSVIINFGARFSGASGNPWGIFSVGTCAPII